MFQQRNAFIAILFAFSAIFSSDFRNWDTNTGEGVFSFLKNYQSPRSEAMSNSGGSILSTDPFIVLLNPASLQPTRFRQNIALSWSMGALERSEGLLAWNIKARNVVLQTSFAWTDYQTTSGLDENGTPTGVVYDPMSQVLLFSGMLPTQHFRLGGNLKFVRDHLSNDAGDQSALGAAFDWGLSSREQNPRFGWALSVLDVGRQFRAYTKNGVSDLSFDTRIRASGYFHPVQVRGLTVAFDADLPRYTQPLAHVGLEYAPIPWIQLRAGTQTTLAAVGYQLHKLVSDSSSTTTPGTPLLPLASAGAGLVWKDFTLDYSCVFLRYSLGQTHRLAIRTGF